MRRQTLEDVLFQEGFGSRRDVCTLIRRGRVTNASGMAIETPGVAWDDCGQVLVDGEMLEPHGHLYLVLHKPVGYECSHSPTHHTSVFSLVPPRFLRRGLQAAGRLDADTSGLLLLSDNGQFLHHASSPRRGLVKTYLAQLARPLEPQAEQTLLAGVALRGEHEPAVALSLDPSGENLWRIAVGEGRYHVVRRMFAAVGNHVEALLRERVGEVSLGDLASGSWRHLSQPELALLGWLRT